MPRGGRTSFVPRSILAQVKPKGASTGLRRDDYSNKDVEWETIKLAVKDRDGWQCRDRSGCGRTTGLQVHHIIPLSQGGVTRMWNLITLCDQHHDQRHKKFRFPR